MENLKIANPFFARDLDYMAGKFPRAEHFESGTILITGCAGFLGFTFSHYFAHLPQVRRIILLDTFLLSRPDWLAGLALDPRVSVHQFDIARDDLTAIPGAAEATHVLHMASIASPFFYRKYPLETVDANIWGLRKLLDFYRGRNSLRGLLFFSSSEIYGDPEASRIPTDEEYRGNVSCLGPRACYDEAKRFGETLCEIFADREGVPIRVVRPFNNYGPGMSPADRRLPADFAQAILSGKDITILSSGTPTRTFCYVADAVVGYLLALTHSEFDVFNIGTETPEISIRQFAEICASKGKLVCGYAGAISFGKSEDREYLANNPERRCPNINKARRVLGYAPEILVEQGVEQFLKFLWHEQHPSSAS
jgi:UDP-glucuronate decarboxylase